MTMHRLKTIALAAFVSALALAGAQAHAQEEERSELERQRSNTSVDEVLSVAERMTRQAQASQNRVDNVADETRELLQEYRSVTRQVDGLKVYNERLERQIQNQLKRIEDLEESIAEATVTQRQITPLLVRMIDGLEQFVDLDVPFHMDERRERVEQLRRSVDRSDISIAEKFRQVLEAYRIENEYGRRLDTYQGTVEIDGRERNVNFLRIGRVALLYQTTDAAHTGAWNQSEREWVELGREFRNSTQQGLRIARQQAAIEIMRVPIPSPEDAE